MRGGGNTLYVYILLCYFSTYKIYLPCIIDTRCHFLSYDNADLCQEMRLKDRLTEREDDINNNWKIYLNALI